MTTKPVINALTDLTSMPSFADFFAIKEEFKDFECNINIHR